MCFDTVEQDELAIRQLVDDVQANQFDVEPFLALHTDDAIIVNFGGRRVAGKDALRQAMTAALGTPARQGHDDSGDRRHPVHPT